MFRKSVVKNLQLSVLFSDLYSCRNFKAQRILTGFYSKYDGSKYQFYKTNYSISEPVSFYSTHAPLSKKKPNEFPNSKQERIIADTVKENKELSVEEIERLKVDILEAGGNVNKTNFDAVFIEICNLHGAFSLGRSFFLHLYSKNLVNLGTIGKFFRLCYFYKEQCTLEDRELIQKIYLNLLTTYPLLDGRTCEAMAFGLALTDKWEEGLKMLKMSTETGSPSTAMYCVLIEAAFRNLKPNVGWNLIEEASLGDRNLSRAFKSWLSSNPNSPETVEKLLSFMENHNLQPEENVAKLILDAYTKTSESSQNATFTKISQRGICKNCRKTLQKVQIGNEEFEKLRDTFLNKVVIGKNIFLKSKPKEFESYLRYLNSIGKVDVVLDGLNIAYAAGARKTHPKQCARMLKSVVQHFLNKSLKVLVIGRKHMLRWPAYEMDYIMKKSYTFFVDDVTTDDPMLLYAAINSGLGTIFVSRDMMRGHKFLLEEPELRKAFSKWQQKHQYYFLHIEDNGEVHFQEPLPYLQDVQKNDDGVWHLPVNTGIYPGLSPHLTAKIQTWLCLS